MNCKFDKLGTFGNAYTISANGATKKLRTIGAALGIKKIGVIGASGSNGAYGAGGKVNLYLAARFIGFNSVTVSSRNVSMTERFGLWHLLGKAGTEVTIVLERVTSGNDGTTTTVTKRLFVPTVKAVKFGRDVRREASREA